MRTGQRNIWSIELKAEDWLEDQERHNCVEADMAELEIDKEEEKVQPYWKTNYKPIIYIFNNGRYTTNISTDPYTITTTDIK